MAAKRSGERRIVRTLELSDPVHYAGDEIHKLEFRKPKMGDLRVIDEHRVDDDQFDDVALNLALVSRLTGLPEEVLDEVDPEDWGMVGAIVEELFAGFQKKGSRKRSASRARSSARSRKRGGTRSRS